MVTLTSSSGTVTFPSCPMASFSGMFHVRSYPSICVGNLRSVAISSVEAFPFNIAVWISARSMLVFSVSSGASACTWSAVSAVFQMRISDTFAFRSGSPLYKDFPIYPSSPSDGIASVTFLPCVFSDTRTPSMYIDSLVPSEVTVTVVYPAPGFSAGASILTSPLELIAARMFPL